MARSLLQGWQFFALASALAAGCSFEAPVAAPPDGADPDGPTDGSSEDDCLGRWRDGSVAFDAPVHLAGLGSDQEDRDPFLSADELTIYFATRRNGTQNGDVFAATRASISASFGAPARRDDISSDDGDSRFSMTASGQLGIVASDRDGTEGNSDVWIAFRDDPSMPFGPFGKTNIANINTGERELDPELSADGMRIYLAVGGLQQIAVSERSSAGGSFGTPEVIAELSSGAGDADPSLSPDELIIVYSSSRGLGGGSDDLWYSTRAARDQAFAMPAPVPDLNTSDADGDPVLSADGCRLYFASDRSGDWELYAASMKP